MTAGEFIAAQARRLEEDPEYRAQVERQTADRAARHARFQAAEQPVLTDLRAVGVHLDTVWSLYRSPESIPAAVPVLLHHLEKDHPDDVLFAIGNAVDSRAVRPWWEVLKRLYLDTGREVVRDRLAAALSTCAVREHYDDPLSFVHDRRLGSTRIYFLRSINRIGNRMGSGRGRAEIQALVADPDLHEEAIAILAGRGHDR